MPNPYYNMMNNRMPQMGGRMGSAMNQMNNMMGMVAEARAFMSNPVQYLLHKNINFPNGSLQNPYGTIQNMLNSGQMTQGQLNNYVAQARQIMSMMGR